MRAVHVALLCAIYGVYGFHQNQYFRIECLDSVTRRGIPLVLARTVNYVEQYSDSAGNIAFYEPGLMNRAVWFSILADGYNFTASMQPASSRPRAATPPYDSGVILTTVPGSTATILLKRTQIAERVYRLTGGGLYRDSVLSGALSSIPATASPRALEDPLSGSLGQDSLQLVRYRGRILWFWGDTGCAQSPREANCLNTGMYSVAAHSCVPDDGECNAADPPALEYFGNTSGGFPRPQPIAPIAPLEENTWVSAFFVLSSNQPNETLYGHYYKNPGDGAGQGTEGVARWDDSTSQLVKVAEWPTNLASGLEGAHTVHRLSPADELAGYAYFVNGAVRVRVKTSPGHAMDPHSYEQLHPVPSNYSCATVNWNAYAQKYLCIGEVPDKRFGGPLPLTLAWGDSLAGPFVNGSVISTHEKSGSSCYNPLQMPHMDLENGRVIFVTCTFTAMWTNTNHNPDLWSSCLFGLNSRQGCAPVVPRYEYNNIVSRIDVGRLLSQT